MSLQYSVAVRNARLDAIETTVSTSPTMEIRTGSPPADCATADSGTVLATLTLPSDWMGNASAGVKSLAGTWEDTVADATGTAGYFRIKSSGGTCHIQGTVGATGSGADLILTNTSIAAGQDVKITQFDLTGGNA